MLATSPYIGLIKLLLSRGATISATAIFAAIGFCNVELLELPVGVDCVDICAMIQKNVHSMSVKDALVLVIVEGEGKTWWNVHQALPYLISKGANLEVRDDKGETPLQSTACL
jgi:ankyrin repeat protein